MCKKQTDKTILLRLADLTVSRFDK